MPKKKYSIELRMSKVSHYYNSRLPKGKALQLQCENTAQVLYSRHCCSFYSLTIRLVPLPGESVSDEWFEFRALLPEIVSFLRDHYLVAGLIVGIELTQKDGRPGRPNKLAGRPHVHIFIASYNDFLAPSEFEVRRDFGSSKRCLDVVLKALPSNNRHSISTHVCRAMKYPFKDSGDPIVQEACSHYLGTSPTLIFANTRLKDNPLIGFANYLDEIGYRVDLTAKTGGFALPSVARFGNEAGFAVQSKLQMALFVRNVCLQEGLAFYQDSLWRLEAPSKYTWTKWVSVGDFGYKVLGSLHLPETYLLKFHTAATWVLTEGFHKKLGPAVPVFPKLSFRADLWEFNDGLYDLKVGRFSVQALDFVSTSIHHRYDLSELPFPGKLMGFLHELCAHDKASIQGLVLSLGGLFHAPEGSRKRNPSLWLYGVNSTFKSWFLDSYLHVNFSEALVLTLTRQKGRFRYDNLPGLVDRSVVHLDDFRSSDFANDAPTLLNLLDGKPVGLQEKYGPIKESSVSHNFAFTTNEPLPSTCWSKIDIGAMALRVRTSQFHLPSQSPSPSDLDALLPEFAGLGLLCNYFYILNTYNRNSTLPPSWFSHLRGLPES